MRTAFLAIGCLLLALLVLAHWQRANEMRAAGMMRAIHAAQTQFQAGCYSELDNDGVGNYGHLSQLTGQHATDKLGPGKLTMLDRSLTCPGPPALERRHAEALVSDPWHGYRFASFLATGSDVPREWTSWLAPWPEAWNEIRDGGERSWLCVAWPERRGLSGRYCFAIGPDGRLLAIKLAGPVTPEAIAIAIFGSVEAALRVGSPRPDAVMSKTAADAFAGDPLSALWRRFQP